MWATNNGHTLTIRTLLDYGASRETKSVKGTTVNDFVSKGATDVGMGVFGYV